MLLCEETLENLHCEEQQLFAILENAETDLASELHERLYTLLRTWEMTAEGIQKDKVKIEAEVKELKVACKEAKQLELKGRRSLTEKTAEWAELEKSLLGEIDALHRQVDDLTQELEAQEKQCKHEASRSSKLLAEYHSRLLEVDQELDELLHFQRQRRHQGQTKVFGDILPSLFDDNPVSSRSSDRKPNSQQQESSDRWDVREESEQSSYLPPEGFSETQLEVFKRLSALHKKVGQFRHCDLSQEVPESEHSLNQAFVGTLPSDLKSLSGSGGLHGFVKNLTRSFSDEQPLALEESLSKMTSAGLVFGSPSAMSTLNGEFLGFTRDVQLEDILGPQGHEEEKTFEDQSSIEKFPDQDQSRDLSALMADLGDTSEVPLKEMEDLGQTAGDDQRTFNFSGLSEVSLSHDTIHTNLPESQRALNSEQVTNRRGIPKLPLNLLQKRKGPDRQIFRFDESSGRAPPFRSPRRESELKLNISVSINNESSITLISECSSIYIEDRSKELPQKHQLKELKRDHFLKDLAFMHQRSREEIALPPLNMSIESKESSHKNSRSRISPISRVLPAKPLIAPRPGLKNFRGRSLLPAKLISPLSIPTSPVFRPEGFQVSPHENSSQGRSSSPSLFNRFRMRRYCDPKEPKEPRLYIVRRH